MSAIADSSSSSLSSSSVVFGSIPITTKPSLSNRTLVVINVATQAPLKLTDNNYFQWQAQWDALLIGYDLYGYVDGYLPCSPSPSTDHPTPGSDFLFWVRQDNLHRGAFLASLFRDINRLVLASKTSQIVWNRLAAVFTKPSRSRLIRLRERLLKPQGTRSVTDYLHDIRGTADEFSLLSHPLDDNKLVVYVINRLSSALKDIFATLRTWVMSISFEELYEQLVEHDTFIKRTKPRMDENSITSHAVHRSSTTGPLSSARRPSSFRRISPSSSSAGYTSPPLCPFFHGTPNDRASLSQTGSANTSNYLGK